MEVKMKMPDLSATEGTEIAVVRWLIEVGSPVKRGQPLLEVETDKAVQEVESIVTGTLKAVHVQPEQAVPVGHIIATFEVTL